VIVVADASVLVAELLRERSRVLFARPDLQVVVAEEQWDEPSTNFSAASTSSWIKAG